MASAMTPQPDRELRNRYVLACQLIDLEIRKDAHRRAVGLPPTTSIADDDPALQAYQGQALSHNQAWAGEWQRTLSQTGRHPDEFHEAARSRAINEALATSLNRFRIWRFGRRIDADMLASIFGTPDAIPYRPSEAVRRAVARRLHLHLSEIYLQSVQPTQGTPPPQAPVALPVSPLLIQSAWRTYDHDTGRRTWSESHRASSQRDGPGRSGSP